jgi:hypothetical protein
MHTMGGEIGLSLCVKIVIGREALSMLDKINLHGHHHTYRRIATNGTLQIPSKHAHHSNMEKHGHQI